MIDRVHILGAPGSGTTTLGTALSERFGYRQLETDDFFWERTHPPFQRPRELQERQAMLAAALDAHPRWVLSGSLWGWGQIFTPRFDLVIFLSVPTEIRLARLKEREQRRYGTEALTRGGAMHETHVAFMKWAAAYDGGGDGMRSRWHQETWLAALPCRSIRLEGAIPIEEQLARLAGVLAGSLFGSA
jgi:adenylate kinase family enzyme